jgi:hypothetical protein
VAYCEDLADDIETALAAGGLTLTVVTILAAVIALFVGGPIALPLLAALAGLFFDLQAVGFDQAFTSDTWLATLCSLYAACDDGVIDLAQALSNMDDAKSTYSLNTAEQAGIDVLKAFFDVLDSEGLNNLARLNVLEGSDCSGCGGQPTNCCSCGPHLADGLGPSCDDVGGDREVYCSCVPITESGQYQVNLSFTIGTGPAPDDICERWDGAGFVVWQVQNPSTGLWMTLVGTESGHGPGTYYYSDTVSVPFVTNTRVKMRATGPRATHLTCNQCCVEKVG